MTGNVLNLSLSAASGPLPADTPGVPAACTILLEPLLADKADVDWTTSANICLLIDCSGSMRGDKIAAAVLTAEMIVEMLHERHELSLVAFESVSRIIFKNQAASDDNKASLTEQIYKLDRPLYGMTDLAAGIDSAMACFAESTADSNIALIISDGEPDSVTKAQQRAEEASRKGVQFFAVGIGQDYKADQLLSMVSPSNGAVYADDEVDRMDEIFRGIVERIDRIFATRVRLNVAHDERAALVAVDRVSPDRASLDLSKLDQATGNLNLKVGNIEDENRYEFRLRFELDRFEPGTTELLAVRLDYDVYNNGLKSAQSQEVSLDVNFVAVKPATGPAEETVDEALVPDDGADVAPTTEDAAVLADKDNGEDDEDDELDADGILCETGAVEQIELGGEPIEETGEFEASSDGIVVEEFDLREQAAARPEVTGRRRFDLVLIDAGENPIRLMREIRDAIDVDVHRAADMIRRTNTVVTTLADESEAESLLDRLAAVGARAEVRANEAAAPDE